MPAAVIKTDSPFWRLPVTALLEQLAASPDGLSSAEAVLRLAKFGPNLIHEERKRALILQFLTKFRNPLVIILLTASALSAFTGDASSFFIIGTIVLMSVTLDFVQEYRAGQAAERLRHSVVLRGQVLRDGKLLEIPLAEMVPGDVALLAAGDLVPCDGRVLEAKDFFVNQALLTGEAFPVEKSPVELPAETEVLAAGVLEGRRTFGNIMKYIMMGTSSNFGNMFSMAGASLFLPFLPMLPVQILLNNLLYDVSELPIPLDRVDDDYLTHPRHWDMTFIRNFMLTIGSVSSVFDFLTFYVMLAVFHAGEALFRTGWFIESMATQVLVIFIIRTRRNPFKSRPNPWLIACSLTVVAVAVVLPFTPAGVHLGFVAPPAFLFLILIVMLLAYLLAAEAMKKWFFSRFAAE